MMKALRKEAMEYIESVRSVDQSVKSRTKERIERAEDPERIRMILDTFDRIAQRNEVAGELATAPCAG